MNKYKLSALSKKGRADIFNEAEKQGVIIQDCNTNGDIRREFVLTTEQTVNYDYEKIKCALSMLFGIRNIDYVEYDALIKLTR